MDLEKPIRTMVHGMFAVLIVVAIALVALIFVALAHL